MTSYHLSESDSRTVKCCHHSSVSPHTQLQVTHCTYIVVDEVKVVSWCDGHCSCSPLGESDVGLVQCLMDVDKSIDDGLSMGGGLGQIRVHHWEVVRNDVLQNAEYTYMIYTFKCHIHEVA